MIRLAYDRFQQNASTVKLTPPTNGTSSKITYKKNELVRKQFSLQTKTISFCQIAQCLPMSYCNRETPCSVEMKVSNGNWCNMCEPAK